jgi:polysaccharide chain length determinant protein (PEP-CTERM system associated)
MTEKIVGMLLTTFVEDALGNNRNDSGAAEEFIDDQLRDYEQRLDEAEKRLADFKRENVGLMPGDKGDYYTRLQAAMTELGATRAKLDLALQGRAELERQLVGEEPVFGIMADDSSNSTIDARIAQNEAEIADLLVRFTDEYPGVVSRRATIERLKQEREAQKARAPLKVTAPNPLDVNPVYQQIKVQLSAADVEVVTLKGQLAAQQQDVDHLKGLVDTIPDIERRLTALNRDYQVTQQRYAELLQRRETVRLTAQVGQAGNHVKFRIIDPPLASLNPVSPNRTILLAGVLAAAFGIALVVAFVLNQLNPVVITSADLRHLAGLPVLGTITRVLTESQRKARRNRALLFAVGCATLILVLGIAVLFQGPAADFVSKVVAGRFA